MWKWTCRIVFLFSVVLWYFGALSLNIKTVVIPACPNIECPIVELRLARTRLYFQTGDLGTMIQAGSKHSGTTFDFRCFQFRPYYSAEGCPEQ